MARRKPTKPSPRSKAAKESALSRDEPIERSKRAAARSKVAAAAKSAVASQSTSDPAPTVLLDPLLRKSTVAKEYRGVSTRHLNTLIGRGLWPAPDIKASARGTADYYFRSTAERARADFIKSALQRAEDARTQAAVS